MAIFTPGSDDFDTASAQLLEELQQQRSGLLGTTIDIQLGIGLLAGAEAERLARKYGADDVRVQLLRDRGDAAAARVDALSVEHEIATVRTPRPPAAGALIHGRITDIMQRAAGRVTVQLIDEKGQPVSGVEPADTDDAGYFAFELKPETVKAAGSKLSVVLRAADVQLVPAGVKPVGIAPGATVVLEVALSTAELERLRLRIPGGPDITRLELPSADDNAASDKVVADKVAVDQASDKAAAEKEAADKASVKAAVDKTAADKAVADKAAADKAAKAAAAEKAAVNKIAAADKAAADKAAANKAAADKTAADKTAAANKAKADKAPAGKPAPKPPTRGGKKR